MDAKTTLNVLHFLSASIPHANAPVRKLLLFIILIKILLIIRIILKIDIGNGGLGEQAVLDPIHGIRHATCQSDVEYDPFYGACSCGL